MADISDVEQSLVDLIASVVYPNGTLAPSAVLNATPVIVRRGWPLATELDRDIPAGKAHITVFSRGGTEHNTTRYSEDWQETSRSAASITAVVLNNTITIGGSVDPSILQWVTVLLGPRGVVSYAVQPSDTPARVAGALAALISASYFVASAAGPTVTVQSGAFLSTIVGVTGVQEAEIKRQMTQIQISLWCPSPPVRDSIGKLLDPVLGATTFLITPDQSACRLRYNMTLVSDAIDKEKCYRRDLIYTVEYPTLLSDTAYEVTVLTVTSTVKDNQGGVAPSTSTTSNSIVPSVPPVNARAPFKPSVPT